MKSNKINICLITVPIGKSGITPLNNLINIIKTFSKHLYVISGDEGFKHIKKKEKKIDAYELKYKPNNTFFSIIIQYIKMQIEISYRIVTLKNVDLFVFFFGGESLFLPTIMAKLFKKNVIIVLTGFPNRIIPISKNPFIPIRILISKIVFSLSDKIVVYSNNIIKERKLDNYRNKIYIANHHFMDFNKFKLNKSYLNRQNLIGFVGGLNEIKGIMYLVKAMPHILEFYDLKLIIIGNGHLKKDINNFIGQNNLNDKIKLLGWIENEHLSQYLNEFKLLILPSFSEGLPFVIIESMCCGTPVLATEVGAIPDIISDQENGFLIKDNSIETLFQKIINIFENDNLDLISKNAQETIITKFDIQTNLKLWAKVFE